MLLDIFDGNRDEIQALLIAALASIQADTRAIIDAAGDNNRDVLLAAAHRLRGTTGTIGDRRLVAICARIEAEAMSPAASLEPGMRSELRAAVERLAADVAAYAADGA